MKKETINNLQELKEKLQDEELYYYVLDQCFTIKQHGATRENYIINDSELSYNIIQKAMKENHIEFTRVTGYKTSQGTYGDDNFLEFISVLDAKPGYGVNYKDEHYYLQVHQVIINQCLGDIGILKENYIMNHERLFKIICMDQLRFY